MESKATEKSNRLWREKSPYLLQHAGNPVNWYPWGEEAFAAALREDKPLFLSIGYSACHWCHVMAHESFEDREVADLLNSSFISVKVDREERPDIDHAYMAICQSITGTGGWPLSIFMTPEKKPFFAGTYFPKETIQGSIGMKDLLARIRDIWKDKRQELSRSADRVVTALQGEIESFAGRSTGPELLHQCYHDLAAQFDGAHGGFGTAPKFPSPHQILFLLRYWKRTGNNDALRMAEMTLDAMRRGGICDHVGFGFHRYSTDVQWIVPHFEKMIYDQALIAIACLEMFQAAGNRKYAETAKQIFSYVMTDMTGPEGGFYSAEDADSAGVEGGYYLWTYDDVTSVLDEDDTRLAVAVYNLKPEGNFTQDGGSGKNILYRTKSIEELADELGIDMDGLIGRIGYIREKLYGARNNRPRPLRDDKILTDWNGLMIAALARGAQILGKSLYAETARRAADFIFAKLAQKGRLLHRYRAGQALITGMLDDYAFMSWGLIELYQATFEPGYLKKALELTSEILAHFWDGREGGFHFTPDYGEQLILRRKDLYDGAIPSGNSVAMMNLLRLAGLTGHQDLDRYARKLAGMFSGKVEQMPSAYCYFLAAADFAVGPSHEVVIAGYREAPDTAEMVSVFRKKYLPGSVILLRPPDTESTGITELAGFTQTMKPAAGRAAAYVCTGRTCHEPVSDIGKFEKLLSETMLQKKKQGGNQMDNLKNYFGQADGVGILATSDKSGRVNAAVYSKPYFIDDENLAFVMADTRTHDNIESNPYAVYIFAEPGPEYKGGGFTFKKPGRNPTSRI